MALTVQRVEVRPGVFADIKVPEDQAKPKSKRRSSARNKAAATEESASEDEE